MSSSQEPRSPFRNDILKDRVVLISGGATGIGFGCAVCFGLHGAKVAIMSRRRKKIEESVRRLKSKGIDAFGTTVDVRDYKRCVESVNQVVRHFGRIDFLINNAAGNFMTSSETLSPNGLATVLGIDLQGSFHMSKACLPHLKKTGSRSNGDAVIVNITATLQDHATPFQFHAAYVVVVCVCVCSTPTINSKTNSGQQKLVSTYSPTRWVQSGPSTEYVLSVSHLEEYPERSVVRMVVCLEKVPPVKSVQFEFDVMEFLLEDGEEWMMLHSPQYFFAAPERLG